MRNSLAQPSVIWHKKGIFAEIYAFVMQWVRLNDARVPSSMSALTVHVCHVPLKQRKWCCCFALALELVLSQLMPPSKGSAVGVFLVPFLRHLFPSGSWCGCVLW